MTSPAALPPLVKDACADLETIECAFPRAAERGTVLPFSPRRTRWTSR